MSSQRIQQVIPPDFGAGSAVQALAGKQNRGPVIGYITPSVGRTSERHYALLVKLSNGGKRVRRSVKPQDPLWGFLYLDQPSREPRYVRHTAEESIEMALGNKADVRYWGNGLAEFLDGSGMVPGDHQKLVFVSEEERRQRERQENDLQMAAEAFHLLRTMVLQSEGKAFSSSFAKLMREAQALVKRWGEPVRKVDPEQF